MGKEGGGGERGHSLNTKQCTNEIKKEVMNDKLCCALVEI